MTARIIMKLRVAATRLATADVLHVVLEHPLRPELPAWSAGAHIDLRLPDGRVRQYSLCGDPRNRLRYEIAIKRERHGRGGSVWAHENLKAGAIAHVSAPRNNLPLATGASRHILIAGGIGITPFVSMAHALAANGKSFELHYCARSHAEAAFVGELAAICGERLYCWFSSQGSRFDPSVLGTCSDNADSNNAHVYVCGPQRLVDAVASYAKANGWQDDQFHTEIFQPTVDENFKPEPFEATLASTGQTFTIPADRSLLDVLRDNGVIMTSSCELGVCGSCECGYLGGVVIHRDKVLAISKRQDRMLLCVSRARTAVLLDL
jgi:ferredoxin-NADP reductase